MNKQAQENGQIIIILALSMVAILALTGLAIDGSMFYNVRRGDQSTADSAALAGAGAAAQSLKDSLPSSFYCGSSLAATASTAAVYAAIESARADDTTLVVNDLSGGNGVQVTCGKDLFATYLDVHVRVASDAGTTFSKIVDVNNLSTTVDATARVYPKQPAAYGNAIVSLSNSCGKLGGIDFGGDSKVKINKGGVFSNSCLAATGNTLVEISGGTASYYNTFDGDCPENIVSDMSGTTCPQKVTEKLPDLNIRLPVCSTAPYISAPGSGTITPGNYNGIFVQTKKTLTFAPGLYCLNGDFDVNAQATIWAENVTFVLNTGTVHFNGLAELHLTAPNCETSICGVPLAVRGLLMYVPPENAATIILNGSSNNDYIGTIYAPASNFKINGTSENDTFNTQIIGNRVEFIGTTKMYMNLEGAELYQQPAWVELLK